MTTDNLNVHAEDERTGGDADKRLPCRHFESEDCDCLATHEYEQEERLRDDELFKERRLE